MEEDQVVDIWMIRFLLLPSNYVISANSFFVAVTASACYPFKSDEMSCLIILQPSLPLYGFAV